MPAPVVTEAESLKDRVEAIVAARLDRRSAEWIVRIASRMWLRIEPERLEEQQLLALTEGLQPLLEKLIGHDAAFVVADQVLELRRR